MTDKDGNPIVNGYQGFIPVAVAITDGGTMTVTAAYSDTVITNGPSVISDAHKGSGSWPDLP